MKRRYIKERAMTREGHRRLVIGEGLELICNRGARRFKRSFGFKLTESWRDHCECGSSHGSLYVDDVKPRVHVLLAMTQAA